MTSQIKKRRQGSGLATQGCNSASIRNEWYVRLVNSFKIFGEVHCQKRFFAVYLFFFFVTACNIFLAYPSQNVGGKLCM